MGLLELDPKVLFLWPFSSVHQAGNGDSMLLVLGCGMGRRLWVGGLATYWPTTNSKWLVPRLVVSRGWTFHLTVNFPFVELSTLDLLPCFITHWGVPLWSSKMESILLEDPTITQLS